jgi:hypothetical protein
MCRFFFGPSRLRDTEVSLYVVMNVSPVISSGVHYLILYFDFIFVRSSFSTCATWIQIEK